LEVKKLISISLQQSDIKRSLKILSLADRRKLVIITIIQILLGALDLLGVIAVGLLGALSVSGLQSQLPGSKVNFALEALRLTNFSFQMQSAILATGAVVLLVGRTVLSIFFTRRILFFLSRRGASISADLVSRLLSKSLITVQERTTQETLYAVTKGVELIVLQVIATCVVLISDVSLLLVLGLGLLIVDPFTAAGTFVIFVIIGYFLYRFMHVRAGELGVLSSMLNIKSNEKIVEVFGSYRESVVRNRRSYYAEEIGKLRFGLADNSAEISFLPYVSKYVIETSVVLGALLIGLSQFFLQDVSHAVATLAIFLAAGSRIAPAVLRVQQSSIQIRNSLGQARPTLELIETMSGSSTLEIVDSTLDLSHKGFKADIDINGVSLTYPNQQLPAISNINLKIPAGASVAFVGPSGAGKTTIIDVILGVLPPDDGQILISGSPPLLTIRSWPGAISYVPQDVLIASGSIRENVALGYPLADATDDLVSSALKVAQLEEYVANLPDGLETQVGERGAKISGGQRQRLGIARAMFTRPHLLVLDEATSALDGQTEFDISEAINSLKGSTTVVMIAHRLSTVRNADIVVYLSKGEVLATGTFDEVRNAVPDFDRQAKLMGL
jgi:ATP-binding cassette, subfamily B, bacterial PglK